MGTQLSALSPAHRVTVEWKDLVYTVQTGGKTKTILEHVSGTANPGSMVALLGPSGIFQYHSL